MRRRSTENLMELGIIVVMLTLVASIAIPRMSRGAPAAAETTLLQNLRELRDALERYAIDHDGHYPPESTAAEALTLYSDRGGTVFLPERDASRGVILGPYLRTVPALPVRCARRGGKGIAAADGEAVGWIYSVSPSGLAHIRANTLDEADAIGLPYRSY